MKLTSKAIRNGEPIPTKYAFGKYDPDSHIALSENLNPDLSWSDAPAGTKSFALIIHDSEVPSRGDDVNKEGRTVPASLPRVDFFHWVLVDIPATTTSLAEGAHSRGVTPRGKQGPDAGNGMRHGLNNYTQWFEGDKDMNGQYFGYDGPCPPWNDEKIHRYHFTIYALDVEKCPVSGTFTGEDVRKAIAGHVLAQAEFSATYAIYPEAR